MRGGQLLLFGGLIVLFVGCSQQDEMAMALGAGKANIKVTCGKDGEASIRVKPFRVHLPTRTGQIDWHLLKSSDVDSVLIQPKPNTPWPFSSPPPIVAKKDEPHGIGQNVPDTIPGGTYKYSVTGICVRSATEADTVVLDPDMIIPPLREQQ